MFESQMKVRKPMLAAWCMNDSPLFIRSHAIETIAIER